MKLGFALILFAIAATAAFFIYARVHRGGNGGAFELAARRPLSRLEQVVYGRLVRALPDYIVLAQVAYSQMLAVRRSADSRALRNRFDRLVADFVVCRKDFVVVAVIELDDRSHDSPHRHEVDLRKSAFLEAAGLPLHRMNGAELPDEASIAQLVNASVPARIPTQH
jgi:very-short-patch-repair endonuclease